MKAVTVSLGLVTAAFAAVQYAFSRTQWEDIGACDELNERDKTLPAALLPFCVI